MMVLYILIAFCGPSFIHATFYFPCTTPNNEAAYCISLFSCPSLIKSVGSSDPSTIEFFKKSLCGDCTDGDIKICCGISGSFSGVANVSSYVFATPNATTNPEAPTASNITNVTQESHRDFVIRKLLPTRKYCGLQHTDDRFYNESETALDEFPWLVQVKWYNIPDDTDYDERCNGVLISNLYVLTDYYCGFDAGKVKLGQHISGQNVSCIEDPLYPECTEPTIEINVTEKFRWAIPSRSGAYNLALLRLAKKVDYTDYIRPICLPVDESIRAQKQESLIFSGWGAPDPKRITKKRLNYRVTDAEECYKANDYLEGNVKSAKVDLICLAVESNNTSQACNGDRGGPLMFSYRHQWFARGILISVLADTPSNYCSNNRPVNGITITSEIIEWILSNMHA